MEEDCHGNQWSTLSVRWYHNQSQQEKWQSKQYFLNAYGLFTHILFVWFLNGCGNAENGLELFTSSLTECWTSSLTETKTLRVNKALDYFLHGEVKIILWFQNLFLEWHYNFSFLPPDGATAADSINQCRVGAWPANPGHQIPHSGNRDWGHVPQSIFRQGSDSTSEKGRYLYLYHYTLLIIYIMWFF